MGYTRGKATWRPRYIEAIDGERCLGCGRCYKVCGREVLGLMEKEDDDDGQVMMVLMGKIASVAELADVSARRK